MEKNLKTALIVIVAVLVVILIVIGGSILFLMSWLNNTTEETVNFLQECPLPPELQEASTSDTESYNEEMVRWCCENYDSSSKICRIFEVEGDYHYQFNTTVGVMNK